MQRPIFLSLLLVLITGYQAPVIAKSVYASDQLTVPLRTGTSTRHKIIRFVPSGEKLELLESGVEGFSRVMTDTGMEGWIKSTNLIDKPGGYEQLEQAKQQLNSEREQTRELREMITRLKQERHQLQAELDSARQSNQQLVKQNDLLGNEGLREWFVIGALVSLGSLFLGLIISRINWRKKDSWSNSF